MAVTVSGKTGGPRVQLDVGKRQRWARYERSERDGTRLVFAYTVKGSDSDPDGISIRKNGLKLAGGKIKDSDGNAARRKARALPAQSGHKVNVEPVRGEPVEPPAEPARQIQEPEPTPTPAPIPERKAQEPEPQPQDDGQHAPDPIPSNILGASIPATEDPNSILRQPSRSRHTAPLSCMLIWLSARR